MSSPYSVSLLASTCNILFPSKYLNKTCRPSALLQGTIMNIGQSNFGTFSWNKAISVLTMI